MKIQVVILSMGTMSLLNEREQRKFNVIHIFLTPKEHTKIIQT